MGGADPPHFFPLHTCCFSLARPLSSGVVASWTLSFRVSDDGDDSDVLVGSAVCFDFFCLCSLNVFHKCCPLPLLMFAR